jgi:putative sigma-54 modulation protein
MKLKMQSIHFDADRKLLAFIQEKVDKLNHFHDGIVDGEVVLRVEKNQTHENKSIQIKVNIPGNELIAKTRKQTFEEATNLAVETLSNQIKKHKEKIRGGKSVKFTPDTSESDEELYS